MLGKPALHIVLLVLEYSVACVDALRTLLQDSHTWAGQALWYGAVRSAENSEADKTETASGAHLGATSLCRSFWAWRSNMDWQERIVLCIWGCQQRVTCEVWRWQTCLHHHIHQNSQSNSALPEVCGCPHWEVYNSFILPVSRWLIQYVHISKWSYCNGKHSYF